MSDTCISSHEQAIGEGSMDGDVLGLAYADHAPELRRFARRSLGDWTAAEDAVQETFMRAWRASCRFDPTRGTPRTWLFAILRHVVVDALRGGMRRRALSLDETLDERWTSPDPCERAVHVLPLEEALRTLPSSQRHALVEVHCGARPYADVARDLRLPVGTIKSRVHYGAESLRRALVRQGWHNDG